MNLLLLTNNLNSVNGITTFLYQQSKILIEKYNCKIFIFYSGSDCEEKFKKLGVKLINRRFFNYEERNILNFIRSVLFCFFFFVKYKIDIINPQIHFAAAYSYYPSKILNKRFIQTVHEILLNIGNLRLLYGQQFFSINNFTTNYIKESVNNANVSLIRCPFSAEGKQFSKDGKIKFISSGRLVKEKYFEAYIKAVSMLDKDTREKAEFYISGEGNHIENLKKINVELKANVIFLGPVRDIDEMYEKTHVFVMSAGNIYEGLGLGIIQASLKKNLIIAPDYFAIKELLVHGEDGFLFKINDSNDLASKIMFTIENYERVKCLVENFYKKVVEEFSYYKNGQIIYDKYCSLL